MQSLYIHLKASYTTLHLLAQNTPVRSTDYIYIGDLTKRSNFTQLNKPVKGNLCTAPSLPGACMYFDVDRRRLFP